MIRVEISSHRLDPIRHDVSIGSILVAALKAAAIPIEASAFVVRGVKRGFLTYWTEGSTHYFNWRENEQDNSREGFVVTQSGNDIVVRKNGAHAEDDEL